MYTINYYLITDMTRLDTQPNNVDLPGLDTTIYINASQYRVVRRLFDADFPDTAVVFVTPER